MEDSPLQLSTSSFLSFNTVRQGNAHTSFFLRCLICFPLSPLMHSQTLRSSSLSFVGDFYSALLRPLVRSPIISVHKNLTSGSHLPLVSLSEHCFSLKAPYLPYICSMSHLSLWGLLSSALLSSTFFPKPPQKGLASGFPFKGISRIRGYLPNRYVLSHPPFLSTAF